MKKLLLILTVILTSVSSAWAEDYSQGYYTMSPGDGNTYFGFYSSSNADSKYGGTETKTSAVIFTFEKTNLDNVYYWYDCNNHKYIYADASGYLKVSDGKNTNDNNYKWFIKDDGTGNLTITDMTNYNSGNPTMGLIQLNSVGGWWASKCTLSSNSGRNTWKLNLMIKKNTPYFISFKREWRKTIFSAWQTTYRYLQYESSSTKMKQSEANNKDASRVWYIKDAGNGAINLFAASDANAMGYTSNASAGSDKISTTNPVKSFNLRQSDNSDYPIAFLSTAGNNTLYISNYDGKDTPNMGLYGTLADDGTRMKVEEAIKYDVVITKPQSLTETPTVTCNLTGYSGQVVQNGGSIYIGKGNTLSTNNLTIPNYPYYKYTVSINDYVITVAYDYYPNREGITVPEGCNGYIGGITDISETEWKTQKYWSLSDNWNNYGPGCSVSGSAQGMWNPIYLQGITGGTVPALDGWNFRMIADHSTYEIASVGKIQGGMDCYFTLKNTSVVTMKFGTGHTFNFTINLNEGTGNILNFVMSNGYQCTTNSCTECPSRSTITVNYGDVTKDTNRQFNAYGSGNIKKLVLNATLTDPAEYNKEESIVLATLNSVSVTDVEKNISGAGWTEVNNYDLLKTQNTTGKFYYIEESISNGVRQYTLHTYKQIVYTVESDKNFSEIYNDKDFANFKFIYIPSGKKLIFDTTLEDKELTSTQMIKAESGTSVIQINEGVTLYTNNIISGQTPTIIGAGTFKTTTYTTSVPLNVTLGSEWTGIVARANANVGGPFNFSNLVNGSLSKVQMTQVQGWLDENSSTNANIVLKNGAGSTKYGFCVNDASDGKEYTFSGNFSGEGDFVYNQNDENNCSPTYNFSGNLSEWTGKFNLKENGTGTTTVNVTSTSDINAGFKNSSTKANTLELIFSSNSDQNINGEVTTSSKNNTLNMTLNGTGTKTIGTNITANNLTIINSNGAEISISGNRIINVVNLYAYSDNNNTLSSLNINMSTYDLADKLGENESCTLISVTGSFNASSLTINGHENVTVGDYDYYISYNDNAITLSRRYYSRNVTSGNFGSICIPNGALVSQMTGVAKVLKVTEVTTDRVNMIEVEEMTPGVPYIFKSKASAINLTLKGETVADAVNDVCEDNPNGYLVGNFEPTGVPNSNSDADYNYYILQSNQFKKVTSGTIKSGKNRCYLKVSKVGLSRQATLGIAVDDAGATGIDAINSLMNNDAEIYDLNGRRLNDLRKGINIVNGVKVLVK